MNKPINEPFSHKVYHEEQLGSDGSKMFRVTVADFMGIKKVELRDWVSVPDSDITEDGMIPSSGTLIPFKSVVAVRKALQRIEAEYGLTDEEEQ